jgi:Family of unknown function (DUF6263)
MKYFKIILSLGAVVACAMFAGCSKSRNATTGTAPISTDSTGPVEMKIKWAVGKRYDQQLSMTQAIHLNFPGMPKPMDQNMNMTEDFGISALKAMPDGGTELEMQITGVKMESKQGERVAINFDSSRDPSEDGHNPTAPLLRKMIGGHLKYDLDADGKVAQVMGVDEFVKQMSGGDPKAETVIKQFMSEDTLKEMVSRGLGLPPTPVKVGDHWPVHMEVGANQVGTLLLDMKYTFKGWQQHDGRKCALMEFVGTLATKPGSNPGGQMNVSIDKGTLEGTTWFDPDQSMVVETSSIENMTLKVIAQGQTMVMPMKQSIIIKLTGTSDITN